MQILEMETGDSIVKYKLASAINNQRFLHAGASLAVALSVTEGPCLYELLEIVVIDEVSYKMIMRQHLYKRVCLWSSKSISQLMHLSCCILIASGLASSLSD